SRGNKLYTLDDCLKIAADANLDIQNAALAFNSQATQVTVAFGQFLPSVTANMGYNRQLNVEGGRTINVGGQIFTIGGVQPNSYNMSAVASYNIFNGFGREANYNRAHHELDAAEYTLQRTRQQISYQIRSQFLAVLRSMQVVNIRKENIELGKKEVERMKALNEAGRVPIGNVYTQEADLGSRELDAVNAENQLNQAKTQLLATLAQPPDQRAEFMQSSFSAQLSDDVPIDFRREIGSYGAAVQRAMAKRMDALSTNARIEAAQSNVTAARSNYMPTLNANGGWSWSNTEFDRFSENGRYFVGFNLSVPILDNYNASSQVQQAGIQLQQREIDRQQQELRIKTEVQTAFLNLDATEKQLEITQRALKSADQNFKSATERLAAGAATVIDYITANTQLVNAKINRVNAVYSYYDAQLQLRLATGVLSGI
ncbi:MAG: TolC family protein, partial [Candidatus Kapabacteria bacterium]|nr:TolC family protein [Candidatus Kapabacteria bacterium]